MNAAPNTNAIVLDIDNLVVGLGKDSSGPRIIDGISLQVREGETLCLVGESGSGKSVTSLTTMGLLPKGSLKATGGSLDDMDAFRAALRKADFASVRGAFKFDKNQHPIQDWYALEVEKRPNGEYGLKTQQKVLADHGDVYAAQCKL